VHLDPEIASVLASSHNSLSTDPSIDFDTMRTERETAARVRNDVLDREGVASEMRCIHRGHGAPDLHLRVHRPVDGGNGRACLVHAHGGGQVAGSVYGDDPLLIPLVRALGCVAVSVDYRLAPEHHAPAAAEDCYAGLQWVFGHAEELGVDADRIAIGGTSGGGGIAAATALMARDRRELSLRFQMLIYPMLDDRGRQPSSHGQWPIWPREMNMKAWAAVLGERAGTDDVHPYQAPTRATNLSGLPPTYIEVGAMEVFRDECIDYGRRLLEAGVPTELHVYPGCCHGFDAFAPSAAVVRTAVATREDALRRAFGG
jgi:acetyl esterase/lipase